MKWFERKFTQIKNVFKWIPIIWNQFDFEYRYAIDIFIFKLEKIASFLESDKAYSTDASKNAHNIRRIIKLLIKVYDEVYYQEAIDSFKKQYGKTWFCVVKIEGTNKSRIEMKYENTQNLSYSELEKLHHEFISRAYDKQKKAEKLVWKLIGENIKYWWD